LLLGKFASHQGMEFPQRDSFLKVFSMPDFSKLHWYDCVEKVQAPTRTKSEKTAADTFRGSPNTTDRAENFYFRPGELGIGSRPSTDTHDNPSMPIFREPTIGKIHKGEAVIRFRIGAC
jgi:hypothetical protein